MEMYALIDEVNLIKMEDDKLKDDARKILSMLNGFGIHPDSFVYKMTSESLETDFNKLYHQLLKENPLKVISIYIGALETSKDKKIVFFNHEKMKLLIKQHLGKE